MREALIEVAPRQEESGILEKLAAPCETREMSLDQFHARLDPRTCARLALEVRFTIPSTNFFPFFFLSLSLSPVFCTRHLDFLGLRSFLLLDLEPRWERLWSPSWLAVGKGIVSCETFSFLIQASKGISMDPIPLENKN